MLQEVFDGESDGLSPGLMRSGGDHQVVCFADTGALGLVGCFWIPMHLTSLPLPECNSPTAVFVQVFLKLVEVFPSLSAPL
jgi:hypothetical protein